MANTQKVNFTVLEIEKELGKAHYVSLKVLFDDETEPRTFIRKKNRDMNSKCYFAIISGVRIDFNVKLQLNPEDSLEYYVKDVYRIYDTAGMKKSSSEIGKKKKVHVPETIKKEIEIPEVEEIVEEIKQDMVDYEKEVHHNKYETIKNCIEANIPVYLSGPAGSGKNHTVEQISKELGMNFYFSNSVQQEFKLTGFIDAGGRYQETEFYKACMDEHDSIFFLDEMDASIPEVLVLLNAAIANGYFEFPNGRVELKNVHFVAAGNTMGSGADELYTGRLVLDQATLDRFAIIEFDYDINIELSITKGNKQLIDFVHELRKQSGAKGIRATFSYRCLTMVTKLEKSNLDLKEILKISVFGGLDKDTLNTFDLYGMDATNKYTDIFQQMRMAS